MQRGGREDDNINVAKPGLLSKMLDPAIPSFRLRQPTVKPQLQEGGQNLLLQFLLELLGSLGSVHLKAAHWACKHLI